MNFIDIAKDYSDVFGFNVLPLENKVPKVTGESGWKKWESELMTSMDIDSLGWNSTTNGIGAISGIKKLRCLDFDNVTNFEIVKKFVVGFGLPIEYVWVVKSGSGKGYHIWFYCDDDFYLFQILGGDKSYYKLQLKETGLCDHIELRWKNCQTVLPPSYHPSGIQYQFINIREIGLPFIEPKNIGIGKLIEVLKEFCVLEEPREENRKTVEVKQLRLKSDKRFVQDAAEFLKGKVDNYDDFLRIGFALASLGEEGREYFLLIGRNNPKYLEDTETALNKKFDGWLKDYRGDITLGTFFHSALKYGWKMPKEMRKETKDYYKATKEYLSYFYDFQFNELIQRLMWKKKTENKFKEVNDSDLSSLFIRLRSDEKIFIGYEDLRRVLDSDYVTRIHPLKRYYENLPDWDGHDYIKDLADTVTTGDDDKTNWQNCFKKWLIAVVACVLSEKEVNHTAIIFQGEQGIGKSRWILRLLPEELKDYLFTGSINPSDKDSKLAVVKNFIIDLDELETLNREEIGFLKSLMTQKEIQIRKPYGHYEEKFIRRSSFIGSVNKSEFLNDMTGSRRFLCFEVKNIEADHGIDVNKVFSQALQLYNNGEQYWFDKNEADEITKQNEKFTFRSMEEEKILDKYEQALRDDKAAQFLTSTEIAEKIFCEKNITNQMLKQIGMVMTKYRFEKISKCYNGKSLKRWVVKEISKYDKLSDSDNF